MFSEELEAEQNLCNISQKTNYIVEWIEKPNKKRLPPFHARPIPEEDCEEGFHHPAPKKNTIISRDVSEKLNLKKYQNRLQTINQIEFPLADHAMARADDYFVFSRKSSSQPNTPSSNLSRKQSVEGNPYRVIDVQFLNRKLQIFQKKHSESQKSLNTRSQNVRFKYVPKGLTAKRNSISHGDKTRKLMVNMQELQQIKRMVSKNTRRNSLPRFHEVQQLRQLRF